MTKQRLTTCHILALALVILFIYVYTARSGPRPNDISNENLLTTMEEQLEERVKSYLELAKTQEQKLCVLGVVKRAVDEAADHDREDKELAELIIASLLKAEIPVEDYKPGPEEKFAVIDGMVPSYVEYEEPTNDENLRKYRKEMNTVNTWAEGKKDALKRCLKM